MPTTNRLSMIVVLSLAALPASALQADTTIVSDMSIVLDASGTEAAAPELQAAWNRLAKEGPDRLPLLLMAMRDASPIAENWLRAAIDTIAERALANNQLPIDELEKFLADTKGSPRARRTAFEWIVRADPGAKPRLLAAMLDDPSLELRYDAVEQLIKQADAEENSTEQIKQLRQALVSARDPGQLERLRDTLKELGEEVDLPGTMGFLKQWHIIGPFDNTDLAGFDKAHPPEVDGFKASATYEGMNVMVEWDKVEAEGQGGRLDLLEPIGKHKEAIAYAYTTFTAPAGDAEIRYESKNATKVWVNGKLVAANEVYHSGSAIDQYRAKVELHAGENSVLVKICQNKQLMPWEKEWDIRLRVVDHIGTPVGLQNEE